jgi:hypothetical protein
MAKVVKGLEVNQIYHLIMPVLFSQLFNNIGISKMSIIQITLTI